MIYKCANLSKLLSNNDFLHFYSTSMVNIFNTSGELLQRYEVVQNTTEDNYKPAPMCNYVIGKCLIGKHPSKPR